MLSKIAYLHTMVLQKQQKGLTTVEYAIAGGLIVAALVAIFIAIGTGSAAKLQSLNDGVN